MARNIQKCIKKVKARKISFGGEKFWVKKNQKSCFQGWGGGRAMDRQTTGRLRRVTSGVALCSSKAQLKTKDLHRFLRFHSYVLLKSREFTRNVKRVCFYLSFSSSTSSSRQVLGCWEQGPFVVDTFLFIFSFSSLYFF